MSTCKPRQLAPCKTYLAKTFVYQMPILSGIGVDGGPQSLSERCEQRFARIVENHFLGTTTIHGTGIFEEGDYSVDDSNNKVTLDDFRAFINNIFVENTADELVTWTKIDPSINQYLFVRLLEEDRTRDDYKSSGEFGEFETRVSTSPTPLRNEIILGVRPSGIGVSIDTNVPNRQAILTVSEHELAPSPHGGLWQQQDAIVSGIFVRDLLKAVDRVDIEQVLSGIGTVTFVSDVTVQDLDISGLSVTGNYIQENNEWFAVDERNEGFGNNIVRGLTVESGFQIFGKSRVHDHWEFNDQRSVSGVSFRLTSGIFGVKSSDDLPLILFDPSKHGSVLNDHINDFNNPHNLTASGINPRSLGVLSIFGDTLKGNLGVESGIAIDGIDFSTLIPLIDGSNADSLHTHLLLQSTEFQFFSPEYPNSILSGTQPGWIESVYDGERTHYSFYAFDEVAKSRILIRPSVPIGVVGLKQFEMFSRVTSGTDISNINAKLFGTDGILVGELHQKRNKVMKSDILSGLNSGNFEEQKQYRVEIDLNSERGFGAHVSDLIINWNT